MSLSEIVLQGTLNPDGTLQLDEPPKLAPGRVQVTVQPLPTACAVRPGLAEVIQHIQQEQKQRGFIGLSAADLAAEEQARQEEEDEYEQRCTELWEQTKSGRPT